MVFCFGLLKSQAIIYDQNERFSSLNKWNVHFFCLPWESKTVQNSTLLLFSKYLLCFSLSDDIFIYSIAEIVKKLRAKL